MVIMNIYITHGCRTLKNTLLQVIRTPYRSIISLSVIMFCCLSLVLFGGFISSMYEGMRENMIHSQLGHIQIFAQGFEGKGAVDPEKFLIDTQLATETMNLLKENPHIVTIAPRLHFNGIVSNGKESASFIGIGLIPKQEQQLSASLFVRQGQELSNEEVNGILVGEGLAKGIGAKVQGSLTILTATVDGGMNASDVTLSGIFTTGIAELDARIIRAQLPFVQSLLDTKSLTKLVILLDETKNTSKVTQDVSYLINKYQLPLEVKTWDEMADHYHEVVGLFDGIFTFIRVIVITIVLISISSIMTINVIERTREIGTIRSMGATRLNVLVNFLLEGLWLGLIGASLGIFIGACLAKQITVLQLPMPRPPGSTIDYPLRIFIEEKILLESFLIGVTSTIVSSFYPAFKAVKMKIVDAIRFV